MPTGSAGCDVDFLRCLELGFAYLHLVEEHVARLLRNATECSITHRARLLVDFFQHKMLETALFRHDRVPGDMLDLANNRLSIEIGELHAFWGNHGEVAIGEEEEVAGVIKNRGNI